MARLYILSGAQQGKVIELTEEQVTVGWTGGNTVRLEDDTVSDQHAVLVRDGNDYRLHDLDSTNWTCVNGERIIETKLNDGDKVEFGLVEARFESDRKSVRKMSAVPWAAAGIGLLIVLTLLGLTRFERPKTASVSAKNIPAPVTNVKRTTSAVAQRPAQNDNAQTKPASVKASSETQVPPPVATMPAAVASSPVVAPPEERAARTPSNQIDELVFGKLKKLGIQPADVCSDAVFVRRAYLDVVGTLPTAQEAKDFIQDQSPDKRQALIDRFGVPGTKKSPGMMYGLHKDMIQAFAVAVTYFDMNKEEK